MSQEGSSDLEQGVGNGEESQSEDSEFQANLKGIEQLAKKYGETGFFRAEHEMEGSRVDVRLIKRDERSYRYSPTYENPLLILRPRPDNSKYYATEMIMPDEVIAHFAVRSEGNSYFTLYSESVGTGPETKLDLAETHEEVFSVSEQDLKRLGKTNNPVFVNLADGIRNPQRSEKTRAWAAKVLKSALEAGPKDYPSVIPQQPPAEAAGIAQKNQGGSQEIHERVSYPSAEPLKY